MLMYALFSNDPFPALPLNTWPQIQFYHTRNRRNAELLEKPVGYQFNTVTAFY